MIGVCVKANRWFTSGENYEINQADELTASVKSDDGCSWYVKYRGKGYYVSTDSRGEEAIFFIAGVKDERSGL